MAVICLACGDALKVKQRRLLDSDSSKHVLPVWRVFFFEAKLQELGLSEEVDVACFSATKDKPENDFFLFFL